MSDSVEVRLTDQDRDRAVERLRAGVGAGQLDLHEFEERLGVVYAARVPADLVPAFAGLGTADPAPTRPVADPQRPRSAAPLARMAAVAGVIVLAVTVSPGLLWLLWPALAFTSGGRRPAEGATAAVGRHSHPQWWGWSEAWGCHRGAARH